MSASWLPLGDGRPCSCCTLWKFRGYMQAYTGQGLGVRGYGYIHGYPRRKSVDMDTDMDWNFHIHGKPDTLGEKGRRVPESVLR